MDYRTQPVPVLCPLFGVSHIRGMCVAMCVYVCVCVYVRMYMCACAYVYVCMLCM